MKNQKNTAYNSLIKYKYRVDEKGKQYSAIDLKSSIDKFFDGKKFYEGKIFKYIWYFLVALLTIKIVSLIGEPFYSFLTNNNTGILGFLFGGSKVKPILIFCVSASLSALIVSLTLIVTRILVYLIIVFLLDPIVTRLSTKEDYSQQKLDL